MARRSKAQPTSRPATCNVFQLTAVLESVDLIVRVVTDLPFATRIDLSITRPSRGYIWTNVEEAFPVAPLGDGAGFEFRKPIESLDASALNKYRHWKGLWPGQIEGIPEAKFEIRVTLNALHHRFGTCNRDLTGSQIEVRRNGHWIEKICTLTAPIPEWLPDKLP